MGPNALVNKDTCSINFVDRLTRLGCYDPHRGDKIRWHRYPIRSRDRPIAVSHRIVPVNHMVAVSGCQMCPPSADNKYEAIKPYKDVSRFPVPIPALRPPVTCSGLRNNSFRVYPPISID